MNRMIIDLLQDFCDRDLARRESLCIVIRARGRSSFVIQIFGQIVVHFIAEPCDHRAETTARGCIFKSCPRRVSTRHQHCARWRTRALTRIGLREYRALCGQPVNIRRRRASPRHAASECREIIDAEIINQDEDYIWWTL